MASSTPFKDLAENFFQCSVCLDTFEEPKQLPCLHRYCSHCLRTVIEASNDGVIQCPLCKQECVIPENGVDGIKTDFHMKSVLEFIQLQKSFENKDLKKCVSCLQQKQTSTYCFKCRDFLCEQCHKVHISSKMFTEHRPHILKLDNMEAKNLTLEKLSSLTENPRCHTHVQERAQLCCRSCQNVPVCLACTYGGHKGHDLHDVKELAKGEKQLLESKYDELNGYEKKLFALRSEILSANLRLQDNVARKTEKLMTQHKRQTVKINKRLAERKCVQEKGLKDIETRRKEENIHIDLKFDKELHQLKEKYDKIRETTNANYDDESKTFEKSCDEIVEKLSRQLQSLNRNLESLTTAKEILAEQNKSELKRISDFCEKLILRYENFTATVSSMLASKDDWTNVQCIPDVKAACEPLIEEMKKEFPELESLSDIFTSDIEKVCLDDVTLNERKTTILAIRKVQSKDWKITGMACMGNGTIVLTGPASKGHSHITVINDKGEILQELKTNGEGKKIYRTCCFLSDFKVATVCSTDEVGIYDVCRGSYTMKCIREAVNDDWFEGCLTFSGAVDLVNNQIIVGTDTKYVFAFDFKLNYIRRITLPEVIKSVYDLKIFKGILLICDIESQEAYAVSMEKSGCKVMSKFPKPDYACGDDQIVPLKLSLDSNEFIYIIWAVAIQAQMKRVVAQYSRDGKEILTTILVDDDEDDDDDDDDQKEDEDSVVDNAGEDDNDDVQDEEGDDEDSDPDALLFFSCISTLESEEKDTLLISTFNSRKVSMYDLLDTY